MFAPILFEVANLLRISISAGQIFLQFCIVTALLKTKLARWKIIAFSIVLAAIQFDSPLLMLGVFYIGTFVYYMLVARMPIKTAVLAVAMQHFMSMLINTFPLLLLMALSPRIPDNFVRLGIVLIYLGLYYATRRYKIDAFNLTRDKAIFTLSLAMLLISLVAHLNDSYYHADFDPTTRLLNATWMFVIQVTVIYLLYRLNKLTIEVESKELIQQYADTLQKSYDDLAGFRHDFYNIINNLFFYCEAEDYINLKAYLTRMANIIQVDQSIDAINLFLKDKIPCMYGIVAYKSMLAAKSRVKFEIEIKATFFELKTMSEFQLNRIISNLLSNAVEHAGLSTEKKIKMQISNYLQDKIRIVIANSVDGLVDLTKITQKGVSSKEGHTGFGLYEVQSIVQRQFEGGFYTTVEFRCTENTFVVNLLI